MNIFLKAKSKHLNFKDETLTDINFLYSLYASTREVELSTTNWSEEEKKRFLKSQFELKEKDYKNRFENGYFLIIYKKQKPIGRVVFNIDETLQVVDLAFIKKESSKKYDVVILKDLITYAKSLNINITLGVLRDNILAKKLYESLGFRVISESGFYYRMIKMNNG